MAVKKAWVSYEEVAVHITRVGRGEEKTIKPLPEGLVFKPGYSITKQAVQKAVRKALEREPAANVEEFRHFAIAQEEECLKFLQPAIRKGDTQAISATTKVIDTLAKLHGAYGARTGADAAKKAAGRQPLTELLDALGSLNDEEGEAA